MIDPLAVDKKLLYEVDGKYRIGLILENERTPDGKYFVVRQAAPSKLTKAGVKGKVVGSWHSLWSRWTKDSTKGEAVTGQKGA
jgi:hypothetical protein